MNYCPTNHLPWDLAVLLRPYAKITCLRDFKKRKTGEFSSPLLETNYGVPQCFTMTPFLFNICVSEFRYLPLNCRLFQYADDTALIFSDPNYSEAVNVFQRDVNSLADWFSESYSCESQYNQINVLQKFAEVN